METKGKALLAGLLSASLILFSVTGCGSTKGNSSGSSELSTEIPLTVEYAEEDLDDSWDASTATAITLNGASATVEGRGAAAQGGVVTISAAGTYLLSGTLADGQILVSAGKEDLVRLVLNGVTLSNSASAPIYSRQAKKTIITLAQGSQNTITDASEYQYADANTDKPDAAVFSQDDLVINGTGKLTVTGNYNNGIGSQDDLKVVNGTLQITAANHGLKGRDSVAVKEGSVTVNAKADGIRANNNEDSTKGWIAIEGGSFDITSGQDAFQAETILQVTGGDFQIVTGGGSANAVDKQKEQGPGGQGGFEGRGNNQNGAFQPEAGQENSQSAASRTAAAKTNIQRTAAQNSQGETASGSESSGTQKNQATETTEDSTSQKALKGGTQVYLAGGTFQIDSVDDAVHSNGSVTMTGGEMSVATGDDGFHADADLLITDGTVHITKSYEGLEGATVTISGGTVHITASDDGINAAGGSDGDTDAQDHFQANSNAEIRFTGGYVVIDAGGDGVDSNGNVYQEGGTVLVNGPTNSGNGALDFDGEYQMSGGVLVAAGSSGMLQAPDENSTQNSLAVMFTESQKAETTVNLSDASGKSIVSFTPAKQFQSIVISTPDMRQGSVYTISTGGTDAAVKEDGFALAGTYSGGTKLTEVTLSGARTVISSTGEETTLGGMGGMRRPGGDRGNNSGEIPTNSDAPPEGWAPPNNGRTPDVGSEVSGSGNSSSASS
ncbi:carbohydrate-binding domain-containing protein [Clostridium minihomine]|uniref:carbohydrate-binding domain-containing protein n=1 Tax=Clostridium minihomine TaxID=2045012 RepID=UPI000C783156|nr:carbohydrate-binding domain-containing protein [Clostridium minihomine]